MFYFMDFVAYNILKLPVRFLYAIIQEWVTCLGYINTSAGLTEGNSGGLAMLANKFSGASSGLNTLAVGKVAINRGCTA